MSGEHVAILHAENKKREKRFEEETMTRYTNKELSQDWEFKILRSTTNAFKKPGVMAEVVEEEAIGAWVLVEKFDDGRLRFKRSIQARREDEMLPLGYNPYRTQFGISEGGIAAVIIGIVLSIALAGAAISYFL